MTAKLFTGSACPRLLPAFMTPTDATLAAMPDYILLSYDHMPGETLHCMRMVDTRFGKTGAMLGTVYGYYRVGYTPQFQVQRHATSYTRTAETMFSTHEINDGLRRLYTLTLDITAPEAEDANDRELSAALTEKFWARKVR